MSKTSLKDYAEDVERCMRCGFCRALCPTWEFISWETGSPRGRMQLVKALLEGEVKTNRYLMERIYGCALCGYCTWRCPPGIKTLDVIKAARAYLMDANCYPREIDRIIGNLETNKSIYDIPKEERTLWVELMDLEDIVPIGKKAEIVYFPGCISSYSARAMKIAAATSLILDQLGLDWTILGRDEWCCGNPFGPSGKRGIMESVVNHNVGAILNLDAKLLLTSCAGCYRTFTSEYQGATNHAGFKVLHVVQLLEEMLKHKKLEFEESVRTVASYHDPCELGRLCGVYEPPREVLKRVPGLKLRELSKSRSLSRCCGGGGLINITMPEIASKMKARKLDEAKEVGTDKIVSSCPSCLLSISEAIDKSHSSIEMLDITEIVTEAMGLKL